MRASKRGAFRNKHPLCHGINKAANTAFLHSALSRFHAHGSTLLKRLIFLSNLASFVKEKTGNAPV